MKYLFYILLGIILFGCFQRTLEEEFIQIEIVGTDSTDLNSDTISKTVIFFENGICKCPDASDGEFDEIDGVIYTVVNDNSIRAQINNGNLNLCTSHVTSMQNLFLSN